MKNRRRQFRWNYSYYRVNRLNRVVIRRRWSLKRLPDREDIWWLQVNNKIIKIDWIRLLEMKDVSKIYFSQPFLHIVRLTIGKFHGICFFQKVYHLQQNPFCCKISLPSYNYRKCESIKPKVTIIFKLSWQWYYILIFEIIIHFISNIYSTSDVYCFLNSCV